MSKEFQKKFMHPTRRKLVNMVLTGGEYEKNTQISFSDTDKQNVKRKVGEIWTDSAGKQWKQLEAGKISVSDHGDVFAEARAYLDKLNTCKSENCNTIKINRVDKKTISKTGYCLNCLTKREAQIKYDGLWQEYEDYKIYSNMIAHGKDLIAQFNQAYNDAKQEYEFVHEDGKREKWVLERDVNELKAEILTDIQNYENEIEIAKKLRNEAWDKLKDKGYDDLLKAPMD
ncbi:MAG: hypothetical protein RLZZ196_3508 [Bacteroidota bacterium]|jgi:transcription elongation factor Elf1